jgi:hypothetical protein
MTDHIIETIGKWGLNTTPAKFRMDQPRPGDVVVFGDNKEYPFNTDSEYGRIADVDFFKTGLIQFCVNGGSVFLRENSSVSISGGPFCTVLPSELEPTYATKVVRFWNWGDNLRGGGQGVDYYLERPVFRLKKRTEETKEKVKQTFNS